MTCARCGGPVYTRPRGRAAHHSGPYCSAACRVAAWRTRRRYQDTPAMTAGGGDVTGAVAG